MDFELAGPAGRAGGAAGDGGEAAEEFGVAAQAAVEARGLAEGGFAVAAGDDGAGEGLQREAQVAVAGGEVDFVVAERAAGKQRAAGAAPQEPRFAAAAAVGRALPAWRVEGQVALPAGPRGGVGEGRQRGVGGGVEGEPGDGQSVDAGFDAAERAAVAAEGPADGEAGERGGVEIPGQRQPRRQAAAAGVAAGEDAAAVPQAAFGLLQAQGAVGEAGDGAIDEAGRRAGDQQGDGQDGEQEQLAEPRVRVGGRGVSCRWRARRRRWPRRPAAALRAAARAGPGRPAARQATRRGRRSRPGP